MKIIFATQNSGKAKEVNEIFAGSIYEIVTLAELKNDLEIEETGTTFYENALIKAKAIYEIYKTPVIADDSGLSVEQLKGEPGVFSARYAGENCSYEDNNIKLISALRNYSKPHLAKFVCHSIYFDGANELNAIGELNGEIIDEQKGKNGFGYDPIFLPIGFDKTLAELTLEQKNKISHRAKSFRELKKKIDNLYK